MAVVATAHGVRFLHIRNPVACIPVSARDGNEIDRTAESQLYYERCEGCGVIAAGSVGDGKSYTRFPLLRCQVHALMPNVRVDHGSAE